MGAIVSRATLTVFFLNSRALALSNWPWNGSWFKEERIRQKIAALDADGFAAMNYPSTSGEKLLNLSKLIAWYFPWDDAIDDAALKQQPADIIRYRDETINVIRESVMSSLERPSKIHSNPAIQSKYSRNTNFPFTQEVDTCRSLSLISVIPIPKRSMSFPRYEIMALQRNESGGFRFFKCFCQLFNSGRLIRKTGSDSKFYIRFLGHWRCNSQKWYSGVQPEVRKSTMPFCQGRC